MSHHLFKSMPDRSSHMAYFHDPSRDWACVKNFWSSMISKNSILHQDKDCPEDSEQVKSHVQCQLPPWALGTEQFGVTDMNAIHECGKEEYLGYFARGNKKKNQRKTFGLRIGYDGSRYQGYQSQGGKSSSILTVEDDVKDALGGLSSMSAGRTDKDVSAISQIISCHTFDPNITQESIRKSFAESDAAKDGRLTLFDCAQVPRKFHALFSATWRRYLYLFPLHVRKKSTSQLNELQVDDDIRAAPKRWYSLHEGCVTGNDSDPICDIVEASILNSKYECEIDVDIDHVNVLLQSLEGKELSFNGFAYKDLQKTNRGAFASRGSSARNDKTLQDSCRSSPSLELSVVQEYIEPDNSNEMVSEMPVLSMDDPCPRTEKDALEVNQSSKKQYTSVDAALDKCTMLRACAKIVDLSIYQGGSSARIDGDDDVCTPQLAMCVELVGTRFLRRMVRILVATVIRECQLPDENKDDKLLLKICQCGSRDRSSMAITGEGLAMAGVGYDLQSLSIPKFATTTTNPKKLRKKALKRALADKESCEMVEKIMKVTDDSELNSERNT